MDKVKSQNGIENKAVENIWRQTIKTVWINGNIKFQCFQDFFIIIT